MNETVVEEGKKLELVLIHDNQDSQEHIIRLAGPQAEVRVDEIFVSSEQATSKLTIIHDAPETKSRVYTRGIVQTQTTAYACIIISEEAHNADSFVSHKFMLMNENSRATVIPALEVKVDDVKAGHAAAISQMDKKSLFYLMSRGLNKAEAERMLVCAFLQFPENMGRVLKQWN